MRILRDPAACLALSLALGFGLTGCGAKNERVTAPVKGVVLFKGKPLNAGSLLFMPKGGGPPAQANLLPDGTYSMTTYSAGDGAVLGEHDVLITSLEDPGAGKLPEDAKKGYDSAMRSIIPDKFSDPAKSGLKVDVKEGENVVDFDLSAPDGNVKQSMK